MTDLGIPLSTNVLERGRIHQRKTNQENILEKNRIDIIHQDDNDDFLLQRFCKQGYNFDET